MGLTDDTWDLIGGIVVTNVTKNRDINRHIMFIRSNKPGLGDPRLLKEITTLRQNGFNVTVLYWNREWIGSSNESKKNDYREICFQYRAPIGDIRVIVFWPLWWIYIVFQLLKSEYDIIHAINFDTIVPAGIVAKIKGKPIIYEIFDPYEDIIPMPLFLRNSLVFIDKIFMRIANAVIVVDDSRIDEFNGIPNKHVAVIYNSPPDLIKNFRDKQSRYPKNGNFRLFYAGKIDHSRLIDEVIGAISTLDGVELIIAGFGKDATKVMKLSLQNPKKIRFIGHIDYDTVIKLSLSSDLLFSFYDEKIPVAKFASSNKLFEAMMCGKPILVSSYSKMKDVVEKENCGLGVNSTNIQDIRIAVEKLKSDRDLCLKLGLNGRKAYEYKYSWELMEKRLLSVYAYVIGRDAHCVAPL